MTSLEEKEIEYYGDARIASADAPIPTWLKGVYLILPIVGLMIFVYFWNGSNRTFDHGYWLQLQRAANTTFPQINHLTDKPPVP